MTGKRRCCPQCESEELHNDHLSQRGSAWSICVGGTLFEKKELLAYACEDCGFVFLTLGPAVDEPRTAD